MIVPGAALVMAVADSTAAMAQGQQRFDFNLPEQGLSKALAAVAAQSGRNLIAPGELVEARTAPALAGRLTADEAVARLLAGTGLIVRRVGDALVVERGPPADDGGQADIVVTGTNVRSARPASSVLTISRRDIEESAAASVEGLMRHVPQNLSAGIGQENGGQRLRTSQKPMVPSNNAWTARSVRLPTP